MRRFVPWIGGATLLAAVAATLLGAWGWRVGLAPIGAARSGKLLRQIAWFTWPAWLLALWTLWRWRRRLSDRHIVAAARLRRGQPARDASRWAAPSAR